MAYAGPEDLRRLLRMESFTEEETATAVLLIELAQGVIEDETGQSLELSTDTVVLDGPTEEDSRHGGTGSRKLLLPRWPVTAVESVTLTDTGDELAAGPAADYTWSAAGILHRRGGALWPSHDRAVQVVYTAGFAPVPPGPRRICLRLAAAGWSNPEQLTSETLGDHSRAWAAETLGMSLTPVEVRTLGAYRART